MHPWLAAVRHDLVKRALWPARDQRDLGARDLQALRDGLLRLRDDEGREVTALQLFARLRETAPEGAASDDFEEALRRAVAALDEPWPAPLQAILALESAFSGLARSVDGR